ncbi:hypothetical protein CspeluHIS016_0114000 [Cutaneotrichosporon spelunceum]|uniref:Amino acid transporter transmembrane domain-containing protein n=1 Tax=Cutaneotrichosporon spelunceum TaxID=1672016 RepID=A0AAD3TQJ6_9TREE|nr:hypothetical protein CspeluHIS016_0114000 [Cutaneotrichosporon spelunceum]
MGKSSSDMGKSPSEKEYDADVKVPEAEDGRPGVIQDAVFGEITEGGPNFRGVGLGGTFVLMTKANVGLGILQIPFVFMTIGLVPGIILLVLMALLVMWTATYIQGFKLNHPQVYGYADIGEVLFGRIGREIFSAVFVINFVFVSASAIVAVSTALNAVSVHATCTAVFIAASAVVGWMLTSIKTLGNITWLGWVGMVSILASVLTLTVAVGVNERPASAPPTGPWDKDFKLFVNASAVGGITAITNVLYAYAATPTYWGIISEMRNPSMHNRMMVISISLCAVLYIAIGTTVYVFCGKYVSTPALGSAGVLFKRICYGLAIPALLVSLCIYAHMAAKFLFIRILQGTKHIAQPTKRHWITWFGCTTAVVGVAYILGSAIPTFGAIVGLIGSLFTPQTTIIVFPLIWWHDHWRYTPKSQRSYWMLAVNVFILAAGIFFVVGGMYAAVVELIKTGATNGPWTCADNSGSVPAAS